MSEVYVQRNGEKVLLTGDELQAFLAKQESIAAEAAARAAEIAAAESAKASAIAKLQELGLTVEEVKAAFGLEAE